MKKSELDKCVTKKMIWWVSSLLSKTEFVFTVHICWLYLNKSSCFNVQMGNRMRFVNQTKNRKCKAYFSGHLPNISHLQIDNWKQVAIDLNCYGHLGLISKLILEQRIFAIICTNGFLIQKSFNSWNTDLSFKLNVRFKKTGANVMHIVHNIFFMCMVKYCFA